MTDPGAGQLPAAGRADRLHLSPRHREILEVLLREHLPGIEVWAYGSRVNGQSHDSSDLDLVLRAPGLQEVPIGPLADFTEALHDSTLPFLVEARDWARLPERFHKGIERGYVVLVEPPSRGRSWPMVRLGDHVDSCLGKMLDQKKNRGELFPYLGNKNVRWGRFNTSELGQMRFEDHEHDRYGLKYGDLVVCEGGEPGRCAIWKDEMPGMKIQKALHRIRAREQLYNRFLHYWFLLAGRNGALEPYFTGTTIKHLTGKAIAELQVPLPPKSEQNTIAHILGTLDDKIELNRRMNNTLEAMGRALFKSWFVDFDPVRAKMEGRWPPGESLPGLPAHLYDLFPDRLVESELGEVPEGWEVSKIGDIASVSSGKRPNIRYPSSSAEAGIPVWGGNGPMAFTTKSLIDYPVLITGRVGTLGSVFRVTEPCWPSDNTLILKGRVNQYFEYLFCHMEHIDYSSLNRGSTQPLLTQSDLKEQLIILPSTKLLVRFSDSASRLFRIYDERRGESNILITLRDTLLPKLISGKLRIKDTEVLLSRML